MNDSEENKTRMQILLYVIKNPDSILSVKRPMTELGLKGRDSRERSSHSNDGAKDANNSIFPRWNELP